jgi:hypothetical protein
MDGFMKKLIAMVFVSLLAAGVVQAHSGGTDSNGCHAGTKPYHCH